MALRKRYCKKNKYEHIQPTIIIVMKSLGMAYILDLFISYIEQANAVHPFLKRENLFIIPVIYGLITYILNLKRKRICRKEYLLYKGSHINQVDKLDGFEFERYLRAHFRKKGYHVELTQPQQDFGVDLILSKGKDRIAVQAKRYNHEAGYKVTYRAVQEVAAGKAYYGCNKGIVITNSYFTKSAKELAKANKIDMWDRKRMIMEFQITDAPHSKEYKRGFC